MTASAGDNAPDRSPTELGPVGVVIMTARAAQLAGLLHALGVHTTVLKATDLIVVGAVRGAR